MGFELRSLGPERYLVWDLLHETDPYYLNQHLFDVDFSAIETDRERRKRAGLIVPSYVAYVLEGYGHMLAKFPELNSYLRVYPFTKLAVYSGVDISLTVEREWEGRRIVLLAILRDAQNKSAEEIHEFLRARRERPLEELDEFTRYKKLLKVPAFCRWRLFQLCVKPFPGLMRELVGTTAFTSIGKFGSTLTTPLSPRTVTLSLGRVEPRPRVIGNDVRPALSAWVTVTYDHRVSDGAEVARFGDELRRYLERPL